MPTDTSEKQLETILVSYLRDKHQYEEGVSDDYNKNYALDTERVKRFLLSTQKQKVENTACFTSQFNSCFLSKAKLSYSSYKNIFFNSVAYLSKNIIARIF